MPQANDWLFDILWDLSDKAHDAELPALAEKLEEAMDICLATSQADGGKMATFHSKRFADTNRRIMEMAKTKARTMKALNALVAQTRARTAQRPKSTPVVQPKPEFASKRQTVQSFAWPY